MENFKNLEIIDISTKDGKLVALMSYQQIPGANRYFNNGFDTIEVPINLRDIQRSIRGNVLVDQSVKSISYNTEHK